MPPSVVSNGKRQLTIEEISTFPEGDVLERKITELVVSHFGLRVQYGRKGQIEKHFYPYTKKGKVVAYKCRTLPKTFTTIGNFKNVELFNQANCAGNKKLIITEGELDAMAVAQAQYSRYKRFYPVVSLPSAAATETLIRELEFIRSYEQVILAFDMDEPGRAAVDKAARIIGFERVRIANLPSKDPCEVLLEHGPEALMQVLFDAKAYNPAGIVSGETIWETFKNHKAKVSIPYPSCLSGLNMRIKGMRLGEIVLFTSGTGCGKSTVVKEIAYHLLQTTEVHVGLAALEESVGDTAEKFIGIALNHSLSNEDDQPTEEELREAFDSVFGSERLVLLDHQGSVADESLSEKIEQLALMGCSHIFLDHITIAVSEGTEGNQGGNEAIDAVMSDLLKIVKRNNIWLGIVSHLRKTPVTIKKSFEEGRMPSLDDIKGSGSIKQIAFDVVAFARNTTAESEEERSRTQLCVLKSRYTGNTGLAGEYTYSAETGRISLVDIDDFA
jgi:twinkle protein